jgi:hypothetical protein
MAAASGMLWHKEPRARSPPFFNQSLRHAGRNCGLVNQRYEYGFGFGRQLLYAASYGRTHLAFGLRVNSEAYGKVSQHPSHLFPPVACNHHDPFRSAFEQVTDATFSDGSGPEGKQRLKRAHATAPPRG